ncbi:MAG: RnfABCDGE type electron transport complex subunit D, partial [Gammaproteobacteria bacterium]|nr:RnfABCDGE type electron transport complex subunit D [Gammaproteobacteria bacterium]
MNQLTQIATRLRDPRYFQIAVLGTLLCFGTLSLDFGIRWQNAVTIIATALATQLLFTRRLALPRFDPLSPLITSLSLTLLLRTDSATLAACAAVIAIGSKFVIRVRNKHVFNPANVAIVSMLLLSDHAWVSSGQWGSTAISALALSSLGFLVLTRARRAETTVTFLGVYALLLFTRALWLGDPLAIPIHQLQNGALLIFAFVMISDPKTSPDTPLGRALFAALVAGIAYTIQFVYYVPNGAILALIMAAPLVPLTDTLLQGRRYRWLQP